MISVRDSLQKYNFRFNKSYGQNFITDTNLLDTIVLDSGANEDDTIVEVGAGAGTLTYALSKIAKKVYSYEIDNNLKPILEERLGNIGNIELRFKDIMKEDKEEIAKLGNFRVVANLPYYITSPVTMFFLENFAKMASLTIMVQKEVAERFSSKPGTKAYGAISVAIDYFGIAKITRIVNRNMFYPQPKVDSAIVHIQREQRFFPDNEDFFFKTVKAGFFMRRKTLSNNLTKFFDISREKAVEAIKKSGLSESIRGEKLSTEDYINLSNNLYKII